MASIKKHASGWRAQVAKQGIRKSKVFKSKTAARDWANKLEADIADGKVDIELTNRTVGDLLDRYRDTVSKHKKGYKWEKDRINLLQRDPIARLKLATLAPPDFADWRDRRLKSVTAASVRREWNLLSHAFNIAIREWEWLDKNPLRSVTRPKAPPARERLISPSESELILHTLGYQDCPKTKSSRVGAAFLFAIETAVRAGEIAKVRPDLVDLEKHTCQLTDTKNGTSRLVPLSPKAVEILKQVDCHFHLTSDQISSLFRKAKSMTDIENLHFHDTRHQAITNLAQKLEVLDLARMVGIKDLKILMVYYNQTAEEIAKRL